MPYSIVMRLWVLLTLLNASVAGAGQQPETMSLLEKPLFAPPLSKDARIAAEAALAAARAAYDRDRTNVDAVVALARAQMALGRVGDSLETLTRAQEVKADDPRLALERGRGLIVIRKFELAGRELRKPAETLPEASCALGMALYLSADYPHAREALATCPDPGIFAYLADWRVGPSARPRPTVALPDPAAQKGHATHASMTARYLDAAERLIQKDTTGARELLKQIVEKDHSRWMDPVYIAAEADYAKIIKVEGKGQKAKRKK
jgi:tetratricopeptide (TPR) repeat protein